MVWYVWYFMVSFQYSNVDPLLFGNEVFCFVMCIGCLYETPRAEEKKETGANSNSAVPA